MDALELYLDALRAKGRAYYQAHKEERTIASKKYNEINKERLRIYQFAYREANLEKSRAYAIAYRLAKKTKNGLKSVESDVGNGGEDL